jgi:hypothetical protein
MFLASSDRDIDRKETPKFSYKSIMLKFRGSPTANLICQIVGKLVDQSPLDGDHFVQVSAPKFGALDVVLRGDSDNKKG